RAYPLKHLAGRARIGSYAVGKKRQGERLVLVSLPHRGLPVSLEKVPEVVINESHLTAHGDFVGGDLPLLQKRPELGTAADVGPGGDEILKTVRPQKGFQGGIDGLPFRERSEVEPALPGVRASFFGAASHSASAPPIRNNTTVPHGTDRES